MGTISLRVFSHDVKKPVCTLQLSHLPASVSLPGRYGTYSCGMEDRSATVLAMEYVPRKATMMRGLEERWDNAM